MNDLATTSQHAEPTTGPGSASTPGWGTTAPSMRVVTLQRQLGAYYTCHDAAVHMAKWVLGDGARRVLEPSFGSGVFVNAIHATAQSSGHDVEIFGAELAEDTFQSALHAGLIDRDLPRHLARRVEFMGEFPIA